MKLTIVGGGGFRVPLVYGALLEKAERLRLDEVVLHDIDAERLARIAAVLDGLADEHGARLPFRSTTDLDDAVEGADYVFSAIRVGPARGAGGRRERPARRSACSARRRPGPAASASRCARSRRWCGSRETIAARAPGAWLINFTNPAGMVTEAVQQVLGDRAVGVCDSPSGLCRASRARSGATRGELWFDYFGLNHLGWLHGVRDQRRRAARRACSRTTRGSAGSRRAGCSAASGCARSG